MDRQRELTDREIEEHARYLAELPGVGCVADVDALAPDVEGVSASRLTDEMLARLAERVPGLRILASDGNSRVTDTGLDVLRRFTRLESLDLEWSAVSDAGLPKIAAVSTLRWVDMGGSKGVTAAGLAGLRAARPDLEVEPQDV
jgi:hypothetical protein